MLVLRALISAVGAGRADSRATGTNLSDDR